MEHNQLVQASFPKFRSLFKFCSYDSLLSSCGLGTLGTLERCLRHTEHEILAGNLVLFWTEHSCLSELSETENISERYTYYCLHSKAGNSDTN